jgi:hypothetical protein
MSGVGSTGTRFIPNNAGRVIAEMSSNVTLTNGSTFDSVSSNGWVDLSAYNSITVAVAASHNGAFTIEFSADGANVDSTISRTYSTTKIIPPERFTVGRQYGKVTFTNNSGSNQTFFRMQTLAGDKTVLNTPIDSVLSQRFDSNPVRNDNYYHDVGLNRREGAVNWRKYGYTTVMGTASPTTIWSNNSRFQPLATAENLFLVSSSTADDSGSTGLEEARIYGVGAGYTYQIEDVVMNGTGTVTTTDTWLGVNRISPLLAGSSKFNEGLITVTAGTSTTVQAEMPANTNSTQQALFFCPANRRFMMDKIIINTLKQSGSSPVVQIYVYLHDFSANTVTQIDNYDIDTSVENTLSIVFPNPLPVLGGQMVEICGQSDTNSTVANAKFWGTEYQDP